MAIMYPSSGPREFTYGSKEDIVYEALKKLPDEYHVIHSEKIDYYEKHGKYSKYRTRECDFVVMHMEKGILCIEAKNREMRIGDNDWEEKRDNKWIRMTQDPLRQAESFAYVLLDEIEQRGLAKPKVGHALWWIQATNRDLKDLRLSNGENLILTGDDLKNPTKTIERLFDIPFGKQTANLQDMEKILKKYLMPKFHLAQYSSEKENETVMLRLLESQQRVLDYLRYESEAAIHGIGGSGKTLIAVERAKRLAQMDEKVLFLCFNADLRDNLINQLADYPTIDVKTINKMCADYSCGSGNEKYTTLIKKLEGHISEDNPFPYKHVIIDEGQDLSVVEVEGGSNDSLIEVLSVLAKDNEGSLYVFYDELQLLYGKTLPADLDKLRSRLTLFTNCRNTRQIASCALAALPSRLRQTVDEGVDGALPTFFIDNDIDACAAHVNRCIDQYKKNERNIKDIVILSCAAEGESKFEKYFGGKNRKIRFTTVRKYKGLEAKSVILVDVNKKLVWDADFALQGALFYAGASRAKFDLSVVCDMDDDECCEVLDILSDRQNGKTRRPKDPRAELARHLKGELVR